MFVTDPIGIIGEEEAAKMLEAKGFRIKEHNWRMGHLEVDLIAENKKEIVFVEVKARPSGRMGDGLHAIDTQKKKRLLYAAQHYLSSHPGTRARFDAVEITSSGLRHIPNAF